MTTTTLTATGLAAVPRVNLMPPEIAEAERFRRLQLAMGGAVLASAVIVGGLYVHDKGTVSQAQAQLSDAQAQRTSLQSKLDTLQNVKATYAAVQAKQQLLTQAMGQEIRWSYALDDLSLRIPSNVWLTSVTATEDTAGSSASTTAPTTLSTGTPASPSQVGTVTFTGVAINHDDVATWLDSLAKERGFAQPTFSSSTQSLIGSRKVVDFGTAVVLTGEALSNRYTDKAGS